VAFTPCAERKNVMDKLKRIVNILEENLDLADAPNFRVFAIRNCMTCSYTDHSFYDFYEDHCFLHTQTNITPLNVCDDHTTDSVCEYCTKYKDHKCQHWGELRLPSCEHFIKRINDND
jgi:hypothetical protein